MTTAHVQLTIEVDASSSWSKDVTADQVFRQAGEETVNAVERIFHERDNVKYRMKIIGKPIVTMVMYAKEMERR